jgi:hypothetical protein
VGIERTIADLETAARVAYAGAEFNQISIDASEVAAIVHAVVQLNCREKDARGVAYGMLMALIDLLSVQTTSDEQFRTALSVMAQRLTAPESRDAWQKSRAGE